MDKISIATWHVYVHTDRQTDRHTDAESHTQHRVCFSPIESDWLRGSINR